MVVVRTFVRVLLRVAVGCGVAVAVFPTAAYAGRVFYVGTFDGMSDPLDGPACGPAPSPCATLAYWTALRRDVLVAGDTVRIAPGVYSSAGGSTDNCILAAAGVTYEGRTHADTPLDDYHSVVIDLDGCGSQGLCKCSGVRHDRGDVSGFTIRDLQVRGGTSFGTSGQNAGVRFHTAESGVVSSNITVDRIWVDDVDNQGIVFNMPVSPMVDCGPRGVHERDLGSRRGELRTYRDVTIRDSKVTFARGVFGGIILGCIDGALVEDNVVSDVYDGDYAACPGGVGCDNHDGIQITGLVNGTIRGNVVLRAGQDSLGLGGHFKSAYNLLIENNQFLPSAKRVAKVSGQAGPNIVFRNNFFGSAGTPLTTTACASGLVFQNNTFRDVGTNEALMLFDACDGCEFVNNVIVGSPSAGRALVGLSTAATDASTRWDGNLLAVEGDGKAIAEFQYVADGCAPPGCCAPQGCGCNDGVSLCDLPAYCTSARFAPQAATGLGGGLGDGEIEAFQAQSGDGQWFGPGSAVHDVWGAMPSFVAPNELTAAGYHLAADDAVARDAGIDLGLEFTSDIDDEARVAPWDIGMDEVVAVVPACASDADCEDGNPCTADRCGADGCTYAPISAACSDGDRCTVADTCINGVCTAGLPRDCDDGNACTDDSCDPAVGCRNVAVVRACDDGDPCTEGDSCGPDGQCVRGTPRDCSFLDDACRQGVCGTDGQCAWLARDGASCDDGNRCTLDDVCQSGVCIGGGAISCDDGDPCTDDRCDLDYGCMHPRNAAPCDDGVACTSDDRCSDGRCGGTDACAGDQICDVLVGACVSASTTTTTTMPPSTTTTTNSTTTTSSSTTTTSSSTTTSTLPADELSVDRAFHRISSGGWFVRGRAAYATPDNVVTIYAGGDATGPLVGRVAVDDSGRWQLALRSGGPSAGDPPLLSVRSSRGGLLLNVSVFAR